MNQYNEEIHDPKDQGRPPPYTQGYDPPQVMRPTNNMVMQTGQPMLAPVQQPMYGAAGQPIPIQHGTMMPPRVHTHHGQGYHAHAPVIVPMVVGNQMGPKPQPITCQSCKEAIVTRVEAKATTKTHLFAGMLCAMCCLPCVIIPYCVDSCRNADHYCTNCNAYIGSYVH